MGAFVFLHELLVVLQVGGHHLMSMSKYLFYVVYSEGGPRSVILSILDI